MHIKADTLDDAMRKLFPRIIAEGKQVTSTRGRSREIVSTLIEIRLPRARLSRSETRGKAFSSLGELCWYLAGTDRLDFIAYYIPQYVGESDDGKTLYGAYGPRLLAHNGINQIANVIALLREKPTSRRAVIQLFDAQDLVERHTEIPCTTTLQFLLRDGRVDLVVTMRSNDAYLGLPHDTFCFTMLQEIVARSIGAELGIYRHFAASMHIYEGEEEDKNYIKKAELYLNEAVQLFWKGQRHKLFAV